MEKMRTGLTVIILLASGIALLGMELANLPGEVKVETRIRYEYAEVGDLEGNAVTARVRLGYETQLARGISILVEGEGNLALDSDAYDPYPGDQGESGKAIISDPQNLELNRLQLTWLSDEGTLIAGRQRIIRNNARFIGNVGWRQNEQTYDAISLSGSMPEQSLDLYYAYLDQANRIFGTRADVHSQREFEMESHIIEAQYLHGSGAKTGFYAYLLGIRNSAASSSDTIGIWTTGKQDLEPGNGPSSVDWRLEFARQTDNGHSPAGSDFELNYIHLALGLNLEAYGSLSFGMESLEGDGSRGFSTPLATLHAHNGFADVFLSTPGNGLRDTYLKYSRKLADNVTSSIIIHDFGSENGSTDYGKELDAVLGWVLDGNLSLTAKIAHYDADTGSDVTKFWLQMDAKF